MILKGSQRGGATQLANHLLKTTENEHVEVHEVRGFASEHLKDALNEAYAMAQGTRCRQFLFSLSLNPPPGVYASIDSFEAAVEEVEARLGLTDQPRAIVFHEKEGRRHAHAVWSRIDAETMTAKPLPYFKNRLQEASREMFLEHGWKLPRGLMNKMERDPLNFTQDEWQQAKRIGRDPRMIKETFRDCWASSDNRETFAFALREHGYRLAQGDRRGFVAVDHQGEVFSVARQTGQKAKDVRARLGDARELKSVDEVRREYAQDISSKLREFIADEKRRAATESKKAELRRAELETRHREERSEQASMQEARWQAELSERSERHRKGIRGLWDRLTGRHARIARENDLDVLHSHRRDRAEKDALIERQLEERQTFQCDIAEVRQRHQERLAALQRDIAAYIEMDNSGPSSRSKASQKMQAERDQGFELEM
jgi:hypothetical protein